MRAQYAYALISCKKYRQINYQLPNEVISRSMTLPQVLALCAVSPKTKHRAGSQLLRAECQSWS